MKKFGRLLFGGLAAVMTLTMTGCTGGGGGGNSASTSEKPPVLSGTTVEIVKDTDFANGFGASWNYGTAFRGTPSNEKNPSLANKLKKGLVRDYDDFSGTYLYGDEYGNIKLIPKGYMWDEAITVDEDDIYWCFEEGYHKNFVDKYGNFVDELHAHKLCVNNEVVENAPDSLIFEQYNNYGIPVGDPRRDVDLVKRIESDRHGHIKTYYDTSKEIRNVAYKYTSDFAYDTWPHLYMQHNLREDLPVSMFDTIDVSFDIKIDRADRVNRWPQGASDIPGQDLVSGPCSQSAIGINGYFLLRYRDDPERLCMFVGHNYFSTTEELRGEILTTEQYGNVFYRERIENYSSTHAQPTVGGDWVHIEFELIRLIESAIASLKDSSFAIKNSTLDDWDLSFFQIGYENMGNWVGEYELKNLSVVGTYL